RNVGNHGLNKRVVFTQCLHDTIFNDSRYGIRYHLVCTNRHADKRVDKVWIAVREEHDRRLPDRSEYDREDEEQEHTTENSRRPPSFKAPADGALVASLNAGPKAGLETLDHTFEIEVMQAIETVQEYNEIAQTKCAKRVRQQRDRSKDY